MLAKADILRSDAQITLDSEEQANREVLANALETQLSPTQLEKGRQLGQKISDEKIIEFALGRHIER